MGIYVGGCGARETGTRLFSVAFLNDGLDSRQEEIVMVSFRQCTATTVFGKEVNGLG